jgi:hypothetical protein
MVERLRVALHRPSLDAELAAGADPSCSEVHALRAAQLVDGRQRAAYAESLKRAIASAERTRLPTRGATVPVARAAVLEARPELLALADDLVEVPDPSPRGVAMTVQLLRDGSGPLYRPWAPDDLAAAAERARRAL